MRHFLLAVFLRYPVEHAAAAVVVEVDIDIGQRDTVGVQESLEQQIVCNGVDLRDAQTVCHGRTCGRATSGSYRNVELLARGAYEVLHDKEVAGETHGLHYVQLEDKARARLLRHILAVALLGAVECELAQIVGFELNTVQLVVSAEFLDLLLGVGLTHDDIAVLVLRELVEQILLRILAAILLLGAELLGYGESGHDGGMVDSVALYLAAYLDGVVQRLGHVAEYGVHLGRGLHPLLLGVEHALGIVEVLARAQAYKTVVRFGILLVDEVHVVGADELDAVLGGILLQLLVDDQLHLVCLVVGAFDSSLVQLQFEIVVLAVEIAVPPDGLFRLVEFAVTDKSRYLAAQTCRAADDSLVILFQLDSIGARTHVEAFGPGLRDDLYKVVIACRVLGKQYKVIAALIGLALLVEQTAVGYIYLAADYGLEILLGHGFQIVHGALQRGLRIAAALLGRSRTVAKTAYERFERLDLIAPRRVFLLDIVEKLLYAEHVAVVCQRDAGHTVLDRLVDELGYARLTVEYRILRVDVKMYEIAHSVINFDPTNIGK